MSGINQDNLRRFPRYGDRRNKDTNVEETGQLDLVLDYEAHVPKKVDVRMDLGQKVNSAVVRTWSDNDLISLDSRPTLIGATPSRELYEHTGARSTTSCVSREHDPANITNVGTGMPGFSPALVRDMFQLGVASSGNYNATPHADTDTFMDNMMISRPPANGSGVRSSGGWVGVHPPIAPRDAAGWTDNGIGPFGLFANYLKHWRGAGQAIPAKSWIQLLLTGSAQTSSFESQDALTFAFASNDLATDGTSAAGWTTPWGTGNTIPHASDSAVNVKQNISYCVKKTMYTSISDFVMDWYDALEQLCLNLPYLKGEFTGFFERGMKSPFWQKFNIRELTVMCWAIQLGMAIRRGQWANNLHAMAPMREGTNGPEAVTTASENFAGVYHPFYVRFDGMNMGADTLDDIVTNATPDQHSEWCAPALLRYIDQMNYRVDEYVEPERNIYTADLLSGLDFIFTEASREMGMAASSIGRGYMQFFEDFKEGKYPEVRSEEARNSFESIRTAWNLGFTETTQIQNTAGSATGHKTFAANFSDRGGIVDHDVQRRLKTDVSELAEMSFLMPDSFTAGMQSVGLSRTKMNHKNDINGAEHMFDVEFDPESKCQLVNFKVMWYNGATYLTKDMTHYPVHSTWPTRRRVVVAWPTTGMGYHVYSQYVYHPISSQLPGTWADLQTNFIDGGYGCGYGHLAYPDGTLPAIERYSHLEGNGLLQVNDGSDDYYLAPMFGGIYYDLAPDAWFPQLMNHMSRLHKVWATVQERVPFKSDWKPLGSLEGVNLIAKLSLTTGESLVQNNLDMILTGAACGSVISANNPCMMMSRIYDRQLHSQVIHNRPARRQDVDTGIDGIAIILAEGKDAADYATSQVMYHWLLDMNGRFTNHPITQPNNAYYASQASLGIGNAGGMNLSLIGNSLSALASSTSGSRGYSSNVRVTYVNDVLSDGSIRSHAITPIFDQGAITSSPLGIRAVASWVSSLDADTFRNDTAEIGVPVFDFYDEEVTREYSVINAAHTIPGQRWYFEALFTLDPNAVATLDNSPCSAMGMRDGLTSSGSKLALDGRARHSNEVVTVVNLFRDQLDLDERPQLTIGIGNDIPFWNSDLWAEYVSYRRGVEFGGDAAYNALQVQSLQYQRYPFSVLVIDQDILDEFTMHQTVLQFVNSRVIDLILPAHFTLTKSADVTYVGETSSTTSGGGVVTGSGSFDESDSLGTGPEEV